jgi:hypothetical protein
LQAECKKLRLPATGTAATLRERLLGVGDSAVVQEQNKSEGKG